MSAKLSRGKLNVTIKHEISKDTDDRVVKIKPLIDKWYQHKAKAIFHERLAKLLPKTTWVRAIPPFRVMAMKKQWGSCSTKGNLKLNPQLVKAPKECIDYVILVSALLNCALTVKPVHRVCNAHSYRAHFSICLIKEI